jgi:sugar-specific transcriptional regulator TrmB
VLSTLRYNIGIARKGTLKSKGVCLIQEDLVKKLTRFGFTINQAKVYLSIIQSRGISAGKIAKVTQLHRQDIYKILPILEKRGLVTRTIAKPFKIQAVPVETALYQMVLNEREKAQEKIMNLEIHLKELVNSLGDLPKGEEEARFILLTTDESIKNRASLSIQTLKKELKLVTKTELLQTQLAKLPEFIKIVANQKIKTSMLLVNLRNPESARKTIEKLVANRDLFRVKLIDRNIFKHYMIFDRREVWIATEQKTESGFPCVFWTNDKNIVHVYEDYFDKGWNHPAAVMFYPTLKFESRELVPA